MKACRLRHDLRHMLFMYSKYESEGPYVNASLEKMKPLPVE